MKQSIYDNLKYIIAGMVIAAAFGFVHADFPLPSAAAPGANIDVPLHTGPDQVKNGGLSVNTFLANQNAQFKQQAFLNGTVFGGKPGDTTSTISIGDSSASANIAVNGNLSATAFLQSTSVANTNSSNLCATTSGTIVVCTGQTGPTNTPTFTEVGAPVSDNGEKIYTFDVGPSVEPGNIFTIIIFYHNVNVTAVSGDNAESIAQKMITAINNTTDAQWRSIDSYAGYTGNPNDPNLAPPSGTTGYKPSAKSSPVSATHVYVTIDTAHDIKTYSAQAHI